MAKLRVKSGRVKVPYQVKMAPELREAAIRKAKRNGVNLSEFIRVQFHRFWSQPIEQSMREVRNYRNKLGEDEL
jgi:hypothetical protein